MRELGLAANVVTLTAEQAARDPDLTGAHVLATARAVAGPAEVRELTEPLLIPGGTTLVFTGPNAEVPADATEWRPGLTIMRRREETS